MPTIPWAYMSNSKLAAASTTVLLGGDADVGVLLVCVGFYTHCLTMHDFYFISVGCGLILLLLNGRGGSWCFEFYTFVDYVLLLRNKQLVCACIFSSLMLNSLLCFVVAEVSDWRVVNDLQNVIVLPWADVITVVLLLAAPLLALPFIKRLVLLYLAHVIEIGQQTVSLLLAAGFRAVGIIIKFDVVALIELGNIWTHPVSLLLLPCLIAALTHGSWPWWIRVCFLLHGVPTGFDWRWWIPLPAPLASFIPGVVVNLLGHRVLRWMPETIKGQVIIDDLILRLHMVAVVVCVLHIQASTVFFKDRGWHLVMVAFVQTSTSIITVVYQFLQDLYLLLLFVEHALFKVRLQMHRKLVCVLLF